MHEKVVKVVPKISKCVLNFFSLVQAFCPVRNFWNLFLEVFWDAKLKSGVKFLIVEYSRWSTNF